MFFIYVISIMLSILFLTRKYCLLGGAFEIKDNFLQATKSMLLLFLHESTRSRFGQESNWNSFFFHSYNFRKIFPSRLKRTFSFSAPSSSLIDVGWLPRQARSISLVSSYHPQSHWTFPPLPFFFYHYAFLYFHEIEVSLTIKHVFTLF